jgi:hypothetical protein
LGSRRISARRARSKVRGTGLFSTGETAVVLSDALTIPVPL